MSPRGMLLLVTTLASGSGLVLLTQCCPRLARGLLALLAGVGLLTLLALAHLLTVRQWGARCARCGRVGSPGMIAALCPICQDEDLLPARRRAAGVTVIPWER